jgi:hypothetical protein
LSWADWFPFVFFPFKIIVLGVGMFFSIKWHHDQAKKDEREKRERANAPDGVDLHDARRLG